MRYRLQGVKCFICGGSRGEMEAIGSIKDSPRFVHVAGCYSKMWEYQIPPDTPLRASRYPWRDELKPLPPKGHRWEWIVGTDEMECRRCHKRKKLKKVKL